MVSYQYLLTTVYSIMADSPNQLHHMLRREDLPRFPQQIYTYGYQIQQPSGLLCLCPDISKQFSAKTIFNCCGTNRLCSKLIIILEMPKQ